MWSGRYWQIGNEAMIFVQCARPVKLTQQGMSIFLLSFSYPSVFFMFNLLQFSFDGFFSVFALPKTAVYRCCIRHSQRRNHQTPQLPVQAKPPKSQQNVAAKEEPGWGMLGAWDGQTRNREKSFFRISAMTTAWTWKIVKICEDCVAFMWEKSNENVSFRHISTSSTT